MYLEDKGYSAKIIADSASPDGVRLTTMEVTFPRMVLAEFNTHRTFSRNSASSRAIPVEKQLKRILDNPFVPTYWGKNQKGMQAEEELDLLEKQAAEGRWKEACRTAIDAATDLAKLGVHKQITNRLLEPFMWHTVICTATEWNNFFALRCHRDAQPEIRKIALMMQDLYINSIPQFHYYGNWHLPFIQDNEWVRYPGLDSDEIKKYNPDAQFFCLEDAKKISAGRCARVSYLTHDGRRDPTADIQLCERLHQSGHMSPLEHVARPMTQDEINLYLANKDNSSHYLDRKQIPFLGNFRGWVQFRKELPYESDFSQVPQ